MTQAGAEAPSADGLRRCVARTLQVLIVARGQLDVLVRLANEQFALPGESQRHEPYERPDAHDSSVRITGSEVTVDGDLWPGVHIDGNSIVRSGRSAGRPLGTRLAHLDTAVALQDRAKTAIGDVQAVKANIDALDTERVASTIAGHLTIVQKAMSSARALGQAVFESVNETFSEGLTDADQEWRQARDALEAAAVEFMKSAGRGEAMSQRMLVIAGGRSSA